MERFLFLICLIDQQVGEKKETRKLNSIWIFFCMNEWMTTLGVMIVWEEEEEVWWGKNWNKMQTNFKNQKSNDDDDGIENFHMLNAR